MDGVNDLGIKDRVKILRIGFSNPMPDRLVVDFLSGCERVLVVEEGEPFLEEAVRSIAQSAGITIPIKGKADDLFSRLYEFDPAMVKKIIAGYFGIQYTGKSPVDTAAFPEIPQRPPNLCSGCSHRATFYEVRQAAKDMDTICPSDIGCYTLGFLPPLSTGDFVLCMGASVSSACGFSKATDKKVIAFIGDSTFFSLGHDRSCQCRVQQP